MSKMTFCSKVLLMRMRRLLNRSRSKNAPSNPSMTGVSKSVRLWPMTSSIINWVSLGYTKANSSDNTAQPTVPAAISL